MLSTYVTQVQQHLNDQQGQFFPAATLHAYINRSRRRVAAASQCLRLLVKGQTSPNQEIYPFTAWNALVQEQMLGAKCVLGVHTIAIAIGVGGWKPMWRRIVWSDFQARFRIYNGTYYGVISEPGWWAQFGHGQYGKIYLAPIPGAKMPMEIDLSCVPQDLLTDNDPEPIPAPWDDAVSYWAAVLCLMQQQRAQDAQMMATMFNTDMPFAASVVCPTMLQTPYGAVIRSA